MGRSTREYGMEKEDPCLDQDTTDGNIGARASRRRRWPPPLRQAAPMCRNSRGYQVAASSPTPSSSNVQGYTSTAPAPHTVFQLQGRPTFMVLLSPPGAAAGSSTKNPSARCGDMV